MNGLRTYLKKEYLYLVLILAIGISFRFINLNWDSHTHIHPDERFLTMVGNAMKVPATWKDFFTPSTSTFNPPNVGFKFFVYGTLPMFLNKLLALHLNLDTYNDFTILGRGMSAFFDVLTLIFVFKVAKLLEKKYDLAQSVKYWATLCYAIAVLPVQLSHFFAVDTFLNFFLFASFYFALQSYADPKRYSVGMSGLMLGAALACKVTAVFILPLNLLFICLPELEKLYTRLRNRLPHKTHHISKDHQIRIRQLLGSVVAKIFFFGLLAYCILRLGDPYIFEHRSWLNLQPNLLFMDNLKQLKNLDDPDGWFPPGVQWISKKPITFALKNMAVSGWGLPMFLLIILGAFLLQKKNRHIGIAAILVWLGAFFLFQSTRFTKNMRYFVIMYPYLAICAGVALAWLSQRIRRSVLIVVIISILIWPLAFLSIYLHKHSRVAASEWMLQNIPSGTVVLNESWDDPLPLQIDNPEARVYRGDMVPVWDPDSKEKWDKLSEMYSHSDYYILSSNRTWASIMSVPKKYPVMSEFYGKLMNEETEYKKVKEFTSYPSLKYLGIPLEFNDDYVDESFTVYDHPKVMFYKNLKRSTD